MTFKKVSVLEQENMMNGEYFEETPAENILDIRRKNRQQYANDEGGDGKTNLILLSSKRKYEQVSTQEDPGSYLMGFIKWLGFQREIDWERCCCPYLHKSLSFQLGCIAWILTRLSQLGFALENEIILREGGFEGTYEKMMIIRSKDHRDEDDDDAQVEGKTKASVPLLSSNREDLEITVADGVPGIFRIQMLG